LPSVAAMQELGKLLNEKVSKGIIENKLLELYRLI
jgi:hypothetical protein